FSGGCELFDVVLLVVIDGGKDVFGAEYAKVQPHSGSESNFDVYSALVQPGETVLGFNLAQGGHLTHGCPVILCCIV
ncbi:serine hydroxymethyltransferase, partial [Salmonella enterica subsp. enterica serovar Infantis]